MYLLGYDIGSSSVKVALVEATTGRSIGMAQYPEQEMRIDAAHPAWAEQNPDDWWTAACVATKQLLAQTGANPERIKLELTESLLLQDVDSVIATMHALKQHGLGFSLDDFGTGYSSLSYLKRLPLDQIKIDQGFVRDVPKDAAIAHTIIVLADLLGLAVIAEGVETVEHHRFLQEHGCPAFQGYLFGRPEPLEAFEQRVLAG